MEILDTILKIAFAIVAIILTGIILMQEGKGGGLGSAFGGAGGEAFGHGVGGINRFTGVLAGVLMALAIGIALLPRIFS
ncbi:MAG TPA: preprotein translocase subunit SecG [Planctomycetota bacterium]|jgi:preprotein translocase subunit SecG|nr:preprotein translocase subunit SecG [Planctomycetota bacterium]